MAEGFAKQIGADKLEVTSSGLTSSRVRSEAIAAMNAVGIDISQQTSDALTDFDPENFDAVISLCGCGYDLPEAWTTREYFDDWQLEDPAEKPEIYPQIRDEIEKRVANLLQSI